jgi:lipopolysaccharide export system permease protein
MHDRADSARIRAAQYLVELHKKYAIAAACIVFVLVGIPAAIKFPRGGVGLVVGMSLSIFSVYYVGLIAGESLANKLVVTPFWAMWTPNILFAIIGLIALWRIRREASAGRGGGGFFRRRPRGNAPMSAPGTA